MGLCPAIRRRRSGWRVLCFTLGACAISLAGCNVSRGCPDDLVMIRAAELESLREKSKENPLALYLIDARQQQDFEASHIPGARNFQLSFFSAEKGKDRRIAQFETIVVYGENAESPQSRAVQKRLMALRFPDVRLLRGGFNEWQRAGLPIASGPSEPLPRRDLTKPDYTGD